MRWNISFIFIIYGNNNINVDFTTHIFDYADAMIYKNRIIYILYIFIRIYVYVILYGKFFNYFMFFKFWFINFICALFMNLVIQFLSFENKRYFIVYIRIECNIISDKTLR